MHHRWICFAAVGVGLLGCVDAPEDDPPTNQTTLASCAGPVNQQLRPNDCTAPAEVQASGHVFVVYWGWSTPDKTRVDPDGAASKIETFLRYASGSRFFDVTTQYDGVLATPGIGTTPPLAVTSSMSTSLPSAWGMIQTQYGVPQIWYDDEPDNRPTPTLDGYYETEVGRAIDHFGIGYDPNAIVLVVRPKYAFLGCTTIDVRVAGYAGCVVPFAKELGGGHHQFVMSGTTYNKTAYIDLPYPGSLYVTADHTAPMWSVALAHELIETVEDPFNHGWRGLLGVGDHHDQYEGGDYCTTTVPQLAQLGPNPSDVFAFPATWSNEAMGGNGACAASYSTHWESYRRGDDGSLLFRDYLRGWSSTTPTGAALQGPIGAAMSGLGRTDVFAVDSAANMRHGVTKNAGYSWSWESFGRPFGSSSFYWVGKPDVAASGYGQLDVYARATLPMYGWNYLAHLHLSDVVAWPPVTPSWESLSVPFTPIGPPAATSPKPGQVDVFALASGGRLYHGRATDGSGSTFTWNPLDPSRAALVDAPDVTAWTNGRWDLVQVDANGDIEHTEGDDSIGGGGWGWDAWSHPAAGSGRRWRHASIAQLGDHRFIVEATDDVGNLWQATYSWVYMTPWTRALASPSATTVTGTELTSN